MTSIEASYRFYKVSMKALLALDKQRFHRDIIIIPEIDKLWRNDEALKMPQQLRILAAYSYISMTEFLSPLAVAQMIS